jgi:hypothetical protein
MSQIFFSRFTKQFLLSGMAFVLAACTTTSEVEGVTAVPIPSATPESSPTPIASPSPISSEDEITSRMSVINSVTIYSGTGSDYPTVGILETGANTRVIETREGNWMKIVCPNWSLANILCGALGEQRAKPVVGFALCFNGG